MGLVLGGLLLAKLYTPPEMLLALMLMLVLRRTADGTRLAQFELEADCWRRWASPCSPGGPATCFTSHISRSATVKWSRRFPIARRKSWATKSKARLNLSVPAGEYLEGLREVALSNRRGRDRRGFWARFIPKAVLKSYYPVAIALKWPTILLLLFFASLILGVRKTCRAPGDLLITCLFGLYSWPFALQSHFAIGERHILPLYPFALLIAGGIWEHARKYRLGMAVVMLALCLNAADALRYAPDYLAYFNVFVKPQNSWRLLTDSNLDWGQGLLALRDYQRQHPTEELWLAYFGSVDPTLYGIKAKPLPPNQR